MKFREIAEHCNDLGGWKTWGQNPFPTVRSCNYEIPYSILKHSPTSHEL